MNVSEQPEINSEIQLNGISWFHYANASLFIVAIVLGFLGNSLVVLAFILSKRIRTTTNIFIVNLAVTDILTTAPMFCVVWLSVSNEEAIIHSLNLWCSLLLLLGRGLGGCSILTLVLIAVSRWILITKRIETYRYIYRRKTVFIILLLTWFYSIVLSCLPGFLNDIHYNFNGTFRICQITEKSYQFSFLNISSSIVPYYTIAPLIVIYCYGSIFKHVKTNNRRIDGKRTVVRTISG
ncbi:Melanopsin-A [Holothuria leucospilota]|uniref:Melanopsin-A n=1 Tax=Holothuria leucospilota TaxID=206669 RepID=A0A9Q0YM06_HOLLE|nr:Melanopsin-A [Holothuria leucospilota]